MTTITATVQECLDAIHTSLGMALVAAGILVQSQNAAADSQTKEGLTEGINDDNVLQIYPEETTFVSVDSGTMKITLGGNKYKERVIFADYYAKQRGANIGEEIARLVTGIDAIEANLDSQDCPCFGLEKIRSCQYTWQRNY